MLGNRCGHCAVPCVQKICPQDCKDGKISGPYLYHKCGYCVQDTVLVQSGYSPGTVLVQWGFDRVLNKTVLCIAKQA